MRIIVRSEEANFRLPIPLCLANAVVTLLPRSLFTKLRESVPAPYDELITKELARSLVRECLSVLRQYKGLELIHVEAGDGTFVSIRL